MNNDWLYVFVCALITAVACSVLFVGCEPHKGEKIVKQFDRTDQPITVTFVLYPNKGALESALKKRLGVDDLRGDAKGFALWVQNQQGPKTCQLHVLEPQHVDDDITLTWGHELIHCAYGIYHKQDNTGVE